MAVESPEKLLDIEVKTREESLAGNIESVGEEAKGLMGLSSTQEANNARNPLRLPESSGDEMEENDYPGEIQPIAAVTPTEVENTTSANPPETPLWEAEGETVTVPLPFSDLSREDIVEMAVPREFQAVQAITPALSHLLIGQILTLSPNLESPEGMIAEEAKVKVSVQNSEENSKWQFFVFSGGQ